MRVFAKRGLTLRGCPRPLYIAVKKRGYNVESLCMKWQRSARAAKLHESLSKHA